MFLSPSSHRPLSNAWGGVASTTIVIVVGGAPIRHHFFTWAAFPGYLCSNSARRLSAVPSVSDLGKRLSHSRPKLRIIAVTPVPSSVTQVGRPALLAALTVAPDHL